MNIVILKRCSLRPVGLFRSRATVFTARSVPIIAAIVAMALTSGCAVSRLHQNSEGLTATFVQANTAYAAGRFEQARDAYQEMLESVPHNVLVLHRLGNIAYYLGRYSHARDYYQRALAEQPEQHALYFNIAMVDLAAARENIKHFMRLSNGDARVIRDLLAAIDAFADKSAAITRTKGGDEPLVTADPTGIGSTIP